MKERLFHDECEKAQQYVKANEKILREQYGDIYIAVHPCGEIVDWDRDELVLSKRVGLDHPNELILVNTIDGIVNEERLCLDSPEGVV